MLTACGREIRVRGRVVRIARLDTEKYHFPDDPEAIVEALRNSRTRIDLFTFIQKVSEPSPKYRYPMILDNFAALPVSTFDHWWTQQINDKTRNKVRKGEKKGLKTREAPFDDALVRGVWEIYNECPARGGRPFPHYGKDIDTVRKEAATYLDTSLFIGAFLGDRLIGFAKLTIDETRTQAGLMHIVSLMRERDKAPTNALIAQAVRACADRGIPYLVYSNFAYGKKQRDSLSDFKEHNGFRRIDVPRYYVALTRLGWVALRLGLHHRLVDRLPESLAARLRELRSAWYNRKVQSVTEIL
jgi:hypothetical protein